MRELREAQFEDRKIIPPRKAPSKGIAGQHLDHVIVDEAADTPPPKKKAPRRPRKKAQ